METNSTPDMDPTLKVAVPQHVMSRAVGDESVLLDLGSGLYFGLDAVGARMWDLMAESRTLGEVASTVAAEYGVEVARVEADLMGFLATLESRGLIEQASSGHDPQIRKTDRHEHL